MDQKARHVVLVLRTIVSDERDRLLLPDPLARGRGSAEDRDAEVALRFSADPSTPGEVAAAAV